MAMDDGCCGSCGSVFIQCYGVMVLWWGMCLAFPSGRGNVGKCWKMLESGSEVIPSNSKLTILEGNFQVSMRCISGISALDVPIVPSGLV